MYKEFIILDLETTGVESKHDEIIEVAGVRIDETGKVLDTLDLLVHTDKELIPVVRAITGIKPEDLVGKPSFNEIKDQVLKFIGDAPIVGHNISFDIDFLNAAGCKLKNPALDTLELAHTVLQTQDYYSLEYLSHTHDFPNKPSHRAMDDVLATVDLMKFLVGQVKALEASTLTQINELVPHESWSWGWVFDTPPTFEIKAVTNKVDEQLTNKMVGEITKASKHVDEIKLVLDGTANLVEADFNIDATALTLAYAGSIQPAIVVVPLWLFYKTNWDAVSKKVGFDIKPYYGVSESYSIDAEIALAKSAKDLSTTEAKLITKITIWKNKWEKNPQKLFLTRDEKFQWEQKIAPIEVSQLTSPSPENVLVTIAENLYGISNLDKWGIVSDAPLMLEDALFNAQTKIMSVNYFNALVGSRRDFIHQHIAPTDARLGDDLFKILNQVSTKLTELTQLFVDIFAANPPTSVYDHNIELQPELVNDELLPFLNPIQEHLSEYLDKLKSLKTSPVLQRQIDHTTTLLEYFEHLGKLSGQYRYFLSADATKFFLDIAPTNPSFVELINMAKNSPSFTVLSPALTHNGSFAYFKPIFGEFNESIIRKEKTDLVLAEESDHNQTIEKWLPNLLQNTLDRESKILVVASSVYQSKELFAGLFGNTVDSKTVLESFDTVGNLSRLPQITEKHKSFMLIGNHTWLMRAKWYATGFDRVIFGKMPFDPLSKPQFRILGNGRDGFGRYTLPRAIIKLKTMLHHGKMLESQMILVDGRLVTKGYGPEVIKSLNTFNIISEEISDIDV